MRILPPGTPIPVKPKGRWPIGCTYLLILYGIAFAYCLATGKMP